MVRILKDSFNNTLPTNRKKAENVMFSVFFS